jgi:hypothetical protein
VKLFESAARHHAACVTNVASAQIAKSVSVAQCQSPPFQAAPFPIMNEGQLAGIVLMDSQWRHLGAKEPSEAHGEWEDTNGGFLQLCAQHRH